MKTHFLVDIRLMVVSVIVMALTACGGKAPDGAYVKGNISGLDSDTLYIYGADALYQRTDTVVVNDGKFEAELPVDTLVSLYIHFPDGTLYPFFADRGERIAVKGSAADLSVLKVDGNEHNQSLTAFYQQLSDFADLHPDSLKAYAIRFIQSHPASLAAPVVLDQYLVQCTQPDWKLIHTLVDRMDGTLKDRPYLVNLLQWLRDEPKSRVGGSLPYFRLPNAQGKEVTRSQFGQKYILLHFWASWDAASKQHLAAMRKIYAHHKDKKRFAMLGVSLDFDGEAWRGALKADTLKWEQVCDRRAWTNDLVKQLSITHLPATFLIAPNARIELRNPSAEELQQRIDDIE